MKITTHALSLAADHLWLYVYMYVSTCICNSRIAAFYSVYVNFYLFALQMFCIRLFSSHYRVMRQMHVANTYVCNHVDCMQR